MTDEKKPKKSAGQILGERNLANLQDYQKTFTSDHGRRVLYDLIDAHGVMKSNFHENPSVLASREGERGVVLRIMKMLSIDVEQTKKLIEGAHEHVSRKNII